MFNQSRVLGLAILLLYASAALHVLAPLVGGLSSEALVLVPIGALYFAVCIGLGRGWRWLAWLTYFAMLIGGIGALSYALSPTLVPDWWYHMIAIADFLCALMLFLHLWKSRPIRATG